MTLISICSGHSQKPKPYAISILSRIWEGKGIKVVSGPSYADGAEVSVLHIDLTRLDPATLPALPVGHHTVNGRVHDISKCLFSALAVDRTTDWDGMVIVKTNLNHFGKPEADTQVPSRATAVRIRMARISWRLARMLPEKTYPVLASVRQVPNWIWNNPAYIVERFMPERDGDLYVLRGWMFLGSKSYGWKLYSTDPLVKTSSMVRFEYIDEVPDEIVAQRKKWGFDFGKFDYVVHGDRAYLLDMNKTPMISGGKSSPRTELLALGIEDFLP